VYFCLHINKKAQLTRVMHDRQCHHSKMAISRHLGFYQTGNSAIRSADPENHCLELNMEWIRCTICKIFTFKLYCDLEIGVRGHSRSSKAASLDRPTQKPDPRSKHHVDRQTSYKVVAILYIQDGHQPPSWILSKPHRPTLRHSIG